MRIVRKLLILVIAAVIISAMCGFTASAGNIAYGAATVSAQTLNIRSGPGTNYTILATVTENDIVVILERTNSEWYYINFHGTKGYANAPYFKDVLVAENFNAVGYLTGDWVYMRSRPSTSADKLGTYPKNTSMTVIGINNGWYKVKYDGKTGYVRSDNMEITSGYRSSSSSGSVSAPAPSSESLSTGQKIANFALTFVGSRYVNGGASPSGFDCSGLVYYAYNNYGYTLSRSAGSQYRNNGTAVSKSELISGDLVFFSSNGYSVTHVGIYIGDDEFVHASTSSTGVIISRLDSTYYTKVWFGARRIV